MTPEESDQHLADDDFSSDEPEQQRVRRLLAATGDPTPMPEEVAHRLDDVLAGLVATPGGSASGGHAGSSVPDLAERRARRWPRVLVAAAAVSVVGLGVSNLLEDTSISGSGGEASSGDAGGADVEAQGLRRSPGTTPEASRSPADSQAEEKAPARDRGDRADTLPARSVLRSESLTADTQRVADFPVAATAGREKTLGRCAAPPAEPGDRLVDVRLDGEAATLVLRAAENGFRLAEVYACDNAASPVASTSVLAD